MVTNARKHFLTHGYVPFGNVPGMDDRSDTSWSQKVEPWDRLAWARARIYPTPTEAARRMGYQPHTYAAYERPLGASKHIDFDSTIAADLAKKLKVRWEWLLRGEGPPWPDQSRKLTPAQQRALDALEGRPQEDQERIVAAIEMLVRTGTGG